MGVDIVFGPAERYIHSMQPSYEIFDHTADAGIRVFAPTLAKLLAPAGNGLYAVIGELVATDQAELVTLDLAGTEPAVLLRDYLNELLIFFERDARVVTGVDRVSFDGDRLTATIQTAMVDGERSAYHREVKAITYHELGIRSVPGGYEATIIVDI